MSQFLIAESATISVDGVEYKADASGVVDVPSEFDATLINCHGLTQYIPAPKVVETKKAKA